MTAKVAAAFEQLLRRPGVQCPAASRPAKTSASSRTRSASRTRTGRSAGSTPRRGGRRRRPAGSRSDIPANHSPKFAPVIQPTLETGTDGDRGRCARLARHTEEAIDDRDPTTRLRSLRGNDRLLFGMILGVVAFWLFAQTTLNIASTMANGSRHRASVMNIAVSITALFSGHLHRRLRWAGRPHRSGEDRPDRLRLRHRRLAPRRPGAGRARWPAPLLMVGRICQGLSAACIMPASLALLKAYWEGAARQRAVSLWSMGSWGGVRVRRPLRRSDGAQRRLALDLHPVCRGVGRRHADGPRHAGEQGARTRGRVGYQLDIKGIATFMVAMVALQVLVTMGRTLGWTSPAAIALLSGRRSSALPLLPGGVRQPERVRRLPSVQEPHVHRRDALESAPQRRGRASSSSR